jgi:small subunit ribosomal protein S6
LFNEYEIVFIVRPDVDETETMSALTRITDAVTELGGHVLLREDWGSRKLAYPLKKNVRGRYLMLVVVTPAASILEIERRMRLDDRLLRFLTVKIEDVLDVPAHIAAAEESGRAQAEIRRRIEVEEEEPEDDDYEMADLGALD